MAFAFMNGNPHCELNERALLVRFPLACMFQRLHRIGMKYRAEFVLQIFILD